MKTLDPFSEKEFQDLFNAITTNNKKISTLKKENEEKELLLVQFFKRKLTDDLDIKAQSLLSLGSNGGGGYTLLNSMSAALAESSVIVGSEQTKDIPMVISAVDMVNITHIESDEKLQEALSKINANMGDRGKLEYHPKGSSFAIISFRFKVSNKKLSEIT